VSAVEAIVGLIRQRTKSAGSPFVVAIDGRSGSGKSTIAALAAEAVGAVVVPTDDFFRAQTTDQDWDRKSAEQRAADALDWRRLRTEALEALREGRAARWHAYDFAAGPRPDGSYPMRREITTRAPEGVIILDGAYSSRPELLDLIGLTVLVEAAKQVRDRRLAAREAAAVLAVWHARWDPAEDHYFTRVRPPERFDLVVRTG
jgi:para-aminobenzoate synthetase